MSIGEFIVFFKSLFDSDFSAELNPETEFRYLDEWSSIVALDFIARMKVKYGKIIEPLEMKKTETIEELYNLVNSL